MVEYMVEDKIFTEEEDAVMYAAGRPIYKITYDDEMITSVETL